VFECAERGRSAKYKLTSTVMLVLNTGTAAKPEVKGLDGELKGEGGVTLSGSMTRQVSRGLNRWSGRYDKAIDIVAH